MKRFAISILTIAVFFVGLGSLAEQVGAKFKSDEKALDIVRRARTALGGEAALAEVRSLVITGRTQSTVKTPDGERSEPGETEIALQFPDKMSQKIRIGNADGTEARVVSQQHDVMIVTRGGEGQPAIVRGEGGEFTTADGKKIVIKERVAGDGAVSTENGKQKIIVRQLEGGPEAGASTWKVKDGDGEKQIVMERSAHPGGAPGVKHNELLRLSLALLLTAPDGLEVNYTFAGESDIDGTAVNIINAEFGGTNYKLFISKSTSLPVAMSYIGMPAPQMVRFTRAPAGTPAPAVGQGDVMFTRKINAEVEQVERLVKFSDYRSTGSVQLPYKWTTSVAGAVKEVFDVTSYDLNPANISERFADQKVFVRQAKPVQ